MERATTESSVNTTESQSALSSSRTIAARNSTNPVDPSNRDGRSRDRVDDDNQVNVAVSVSQDDNDINNDNSNRENASSDRRTAPLHHQQDIVDEKHEERSDDYALPTSSSNNYNNNSITVSSKTSLNDSKNISPGNSSGSGSNIIVRRQDQYVTKTSDDDDIVISKITYSDQQSSGVIRNTSREVQGSDNPVDTSESGEHDNPTTADIPPSSLERIAQSNRPSSGSLARYPSTDSGVADSNYSQYRFNADQGDHSADTDSLLQSTGITTQVDAELVVEPSPLLRSNTVVNARVEVASVPVIQGEIIDDEFIQRMRQQHLENNDDERGNNNTKVSNIASTSSPKKWNRRYVIIATFSLITVIVIIVIVVIVVIMGEDNTTVSKGAGSNTTNSSNETVTRPDERIPYTGTDTIYNYPIITQHAVIMQTRVDCQSIVSLSPPYNTIEITCGNGYEFDGSEAIELVSSSLLDCKRVEDNVIQCQSNWKQSGTTFSSVVFRCGINHTVTDTNRNQQFFVATASTSPLHGISCASDPEVQVAMYRFCKAPVTSSTVPAELSTVQPINQEDYCGLGTLFQKDTASLCGSTGVYDCSSYSNSICGSKVREITIYDPEVDENNSQCEINGPADGSNTSVAEYLPSSITTSILVDQIQTSFVSFRTRK
jgi:hypothetical protein